MQRFQFLPLIVAFVLGSVSATSRADMTVWFELVSSDAGVVSIDSGPGKVLVLSDPKEASLFTVTTRMRANVTGPALLGHCTTLTADYGATVTATNPTFPTPSLSASCGSPSGGVPGPGDIYTNFGAVALGGPGLSGNNVDLGTVTFTVDPTLGAYQYGEISTRLDFEFAWYGTDFMPPVMRFGASPFFDSSLPESEEYPVIQIIPEPAAVSFVLIGMLPVVACRRRS